MNARATLALALGAIGFAGCRGCAEPLAKPADLARVAQAFRSDADYHRVLEEFEKDPKAARAAVHQSSAPTGSRQAFLLRVMEDHLAHASDYRDWRRKLVETAAPEARQLGPSFPGGMRGLDGARHMYFWAERLLVPTSDAIQAVAARQLERIGGDVAREALGLAARDTRARPGLGPTTIFDALGRMGEAVALVDALAAWSASSWPEAPRRIAVNRIAGALERLDEGLRRKAAAAAFAGVSDPRRTEAERRGYLQAIGAAGSGPDLSRLAELRRQPWSAPLKRDFDAAIARILARTAPLGRPDGGSE